MSLKRLISMTAVCLLGALAFSGSQAAAQQADDTWGKAECTLLPGAVAGTAPGGVNSVATDTGQGQSYDPVTSLMDTDPGIFDFTGNAFCEGADTAAEWTDKGGGTGPETFAQQVLIVAKGIYDNLICGTGDAKGTAVVTDDPGPADVTDADIEIHTQFALQFEAGVGKLSIVVQGAPSEAGQGSHSHVDENQIDQGAGEGAITITPSEWEQQGELGVEGCVGTPGVQKKGDVTKFIVNGAFETSLAGEGQTVVDPTSDSDQ